MHTSFGTVWDFASNTNRYPISLIQPLQRHDAKQNVGDIGFAEMNSVIRVTLCYPILVVPPNAIINQKKA